MQEAGFVLLEVAASCARYGESSQLIAVYRNRHTAHGKKYLTMYFRTN